jgi:LIM domain kinase 1
MAPEIILGMTFDKRVDIFSFGVILCELATRSVSTESNETFRRIIPGFGLNELEIRNAALSEGTSESFVTLALQCAEDDPQKRPNWRQIQSDLKSYEMEFIKDDASHIGMYQGWY